MFVSKFIKIFFILLLGVELCASKKVEKVYASDDLVKKISFILNKAKSIDPAKIKIKKSRKIKVLILKNNLVVLNIFDEQVCKSIKDDKYCENKSINDFYDEEGDLDRIYLTIYLSKNIANLTDQLVIHYKTFPEDEKLFTLAYNKVNREIYYPNYNFKNNNYRALGDDSMIDDYKRFEEVIEYLYIIFTKYVNIKGE